MVITLNCLETAKFKLFEDEETFDELQIQAYNFLESLVSPVWIHDQWKPTLNALLRISKQSVLIFWSGAELPILLMCS